MKKKLLVVVDMQNDFVDGTLGSPDAKAIVNNVVEKIENWKGYVAATQDTHHSDSYGNTLEGRTIGISHCFEDTEGWEIQQDVRSALENHGAYIGPLRKNTFASDKITELVTYVEGISTERVDYRGCCCEELEDDSYESRRNFMETYSPNLEVTLIGVCTDICVISNAMALRAHYPNMKITVDSSCCAGLSKEKHEAALEVMRSCEIDVE